MVLVSPAGGPGACWDAEGQASYTENWGGPQMTLLALLRIPPPCSFKLRTLPPKPVLTLDWLTVTLRAG